MTPKTFRVMSYNIHQGKLDDCMARGADVIRAAGADIVGVQEAWRDAANPANDNLGHLARRLGFQHAYMPIDFIEGYERGRVYREPDAAPGQKAFGDAVLSRFPIVSADAKVLTYMPPPEDPWKQYRGVLRATLQLGDKQVQFVTCHLGASDVERRVQCREVIDFADSEPGIHIVTGDFNTLPSFDYYGELTQRGFVDAWTEKGTGDGFTMRPERPYKRIDYVLYQPNRGIRLLNIAVGDHGVSDHMSLVAEFEFA